MSLSLNETQQMLSSSVGTMLERNYSTSALTEGETIPNLWDQFTELGLHAAELSEEQGGLGISFEDLLVIFNNFGQTRAVTPLLETTIMGSWLLAASNHSPSKTLLSSVAEGNASIVLAHEENGTHCDVNWTKTTADLADGTWTLNGAKSIVFAGNIATHFLIPAKITTDEKTKIGIFLVDAKQQGLSVHKLQLYEGSGAAELRLNNIQISADAFISQAGQAKFLLELALDRGRTAICYEVLGLCEALHKLTLEYVKDRKQFGQAIGSFQTMQHRLADMHMELELIRSASSLALSAIQEDITADERKSSISTAMLAISRSIQIIGKNAIQAHGAIAITREYIAGHYFQRLTLLERYLGNQDYHLNRFIELEYSN